MKQIFIEGAYVIRDSGKAILVEASDFDEPQWIPKSVVTDDSEVWNEDQDPGTLAVKYWYAEKKGWV